VVAGVQRVTVLCLSRVIEQRLHRELVVSAKLQPRRPPMLFRPTLGQKPPCEKVTG